MNQVLSAAQWKEADAHYIRAAGINSLQLMERAASGCAEWLHTHWQESKQVLVMAGHGNNGGDGLAIARMLLEKGHQVQVYRVEASNYSTDNQTNALSLPAGVWINPDSLEDALKACAVLVDALLGFGTTRKASGTYADCIERINQSKKPVYSIDLPSGMPADLPFDSEWPVVKATYTLCLAGWKLNLLLPPGGALSGQVHFIPLGLETAYRAQIPLAQVYQPEEHIKLLMNRPRFAHKGNFGHALLVSGSTGMWGAAMLAAEACMRVGAGKTTVAGPDGLKAPIAGRLPEAMYLQSGEDCWELPVDTRAFSALGIGPGLGQSPKTCKALEQLLTTYHGPLVLDADALNILAEFPELQKLLQPNTILTPHPREFDRLFGPHPDWWSRLDTARQLSQEKSWVIVLKNAYTFTFSGNSAFPKVNTTGNPGLAKAGSGDVLTGLITGLLAQGFSAADAAALGVYLHGLAADLAKDELPEMSLMASDVVSAIRHAISALSKTSTSY